MEGLRPDPDGGYVAMAASPAVELREEVTDWFRHLERCVRTVDYDGARPIFAEEAVGFGTYGAMLDGLDALVPGQWQQIWPNIKGFTFDLESLRFGGEGACVWGICRWDSVGQNADGSTFDRPGRATVILERRDGVLKALHTHFSLVPRPAAAG
jgi:ketosteroid isomerase-like protein